jgi:hypothetical protein
MVSAARAIGSVWRGSKRQTEDFIIEKLEIPKSEIPDSGKSGYTTDGRLDHYALCHTQNDSYHIVPRGLLQ